MVPKFEFEFEFAYQFTNSKQKTHWHETFEDIFYALMVILNRNNNYVME